MPRGKEAGDRSKNDKVCFEVDVRPLISDFSINFGANPCASGMAYRSVIGSGRAPIVQEDAEEKRKAHFIYFQGTMSLRVHPD